MQSINIKEQIRIAVNLEWPAFAARHPHLASVIDQDLLVDSAAEQLADDPEYREIMEAALSIGVGADSVYTFVHTFVSKVIGRLG